MRRSMAQFFLERKSAEGRWTSAGHPEASVFASANAARRALANMARCGAIREELRIRRSEWSESCLRYFEEVL